VTTPPPFPLTSIMVTSDRMPDDSYAVTLSLGPDRSWTLPEPRAFRYATAMFQAATAAEHDAALYHSLVCKGLPEDLIGTVISGARDARPAQDKWTHPLIVTPGITAREPHRPMLSVRHVEGAWEDGWQWSPTEARQHASHVLHAAAAVRLDSALAEVLTRIGVDVETAAAVVEHIGGHWPEED